MLKEAGDNDRRIPFTYKGITTEQAVEETKLALKCPQCKHLNHIPVKRLILSDDTSKSLRKNNINLYEPLETAKCEKCDNVIASPEMLIHIK